MATAMDEVTKTAGFVVEQHREEAEMLTGFETRNRYTVSDIDGNRLYTAAEEKGSFLARFTWGSMRPFQVWVTQSTGQRVLRIHRRLRLYLYRADVYDAEDNCIGNIQRLFRLFRPLYSVRDASGMELCRLEGQFLFQRRFQIVRAGTKQGEILKKWQGALKEAFTDADTFGVAFGAEWPNKLKALLLGAVFLIDFAHFEENNPFQLSAGR